MHYKNHDEKNYQVKLYKSRKFLCLVYLDANAFFDQCILFSKTFSYLSIGWRPRRTIMLCSWDAEEHGLMGSVEWGKVREVKHETR